MAKLGTAWVCAFAAGVALAGIAFPEGEFIFTAPKPAPKHREDVLLRNLQPALRHFPETALVGILPEKHGDQEGAIVVRYLLAPRQVAFVDEQIRPEWAVAPFWNGRQRAASLGYEVVQEWEGGVLLLHRNR